MDLRSEVNSQVFMTPIIPLPPIAEEVKVTRKKLF